MTTVLTDLVAAFQEATSGWFASLFPIARNLFFSLAAIELVWAASWWVLERDDPSQVLIEFLRRLLAIGFFLAVLTFADVWIPALIDGFGAAGREAAGIPELNPSTVIDQGISVASALISSISLAGWFTAPGGSFVAALAALLSFLAFVVIAAQLAITLVEMYIVIGGGVLLLGFAGSRWTMPFAERYLSYAFAVGIKLFVLYLVIGVGTALAASWEPLLAGAGSSPSDLFAALGASLVYMLVAWQVPSFASALIAGSVNLTLGTALTTGATVGAAAVGAGALVARAGSAAAGATAAMAETGRYVRDARVAGGLGAGRAFAGGASALVSASVAARAWRVAGIPTPPVAASVRDRRVLAFGEPATNRGFTPGSAVAASTGRPPTGGDTRATRPGERGPQ